MQPNTATIADLYNRLGAATGPDGNPILSIYTPDGSIWYVSQRMFDSSTGLEVSPLLTAFDAGQLAQSVTDNQTEAATLATLQALLSGAQAQQAQAGGPLTQSISAGAQTTTGPGKIMG